jgi:hypothetical protein
MTGKRVQFDDGTWKAPDLLAKAHAGLPGSRRRAAAPRPSCRMPSLGKRGTKQHRATRRSDLDDDWELRVGLRWRGAPRSLVTEPQCPRAGAMGTRQFRRHGWHFLPAGRPLALPSAVSLGAPVPCLDEGSQTCPAPSGLFPYLRCVGRQRPRICAGQFRHEDLPDYRSRTSWKSELVLLLPVWRA